MADDETTLDGETADPLRTAVLGLCATVLAIVFFVLLIVDQASAMSF